MRKCFIFAPRNNKEMRNLFYILPFIALAISCNRHITNRIFNSEEAGTIVKNTSERNKSYQSLTERDETLLQDVIAYYKENGTSNDLMEAYYLLGCVYRDLHEAPKAMEAFLNGINVADTLDKACRFDILIRLYGQKNDILYKQKLYRQASAEQDVIAKYSQKARDTLYWVASLWQKIDINAQLCNYEYVAKECWRALEISKKMNQMRYAARQLNASVLANIELGHLEDAEKLIKLYEHFSEEVDTLTFECDFPIYYYTKGRLFAAQGKLDSAELYFRREMKEIDWNNRQAAYRGLRLVFEKAGQVDSALKYARLQCDAVDSAYQENVTANLQNLHELYDYSRAQKDSYEKSLQLEEKQSRLQTMWLAMGMLMLAMLFVSYYLYSRYNRRIVEAALELERAYAQLAEQEHALALLNEQLKHAHDDSEKALLAEQVKRAEEETQRQEQVVKDKQEELKRLRKWVQGKAREVRKRYQGEKLFQLLLDKVKADKMATPEDYEQVEERLLSDDARLMHRFYKQVPDASEADRNTFLLLRFGLRKAEVAALMAHERAASANTCDRMFERCMGRMPSARAEAYNWLLDL